MFGKSSHAGVGRAHPDAILGVLEEGQHPVGEQAARIARIVAVTDKSLAIAIELKEAVLSPYPECSVPVFENRSSRFEIGAAARRQEGEPGPLAVDERKTIPSGDDPDSARMVLKKSNVRISSNGGFRSGLLRRRCFVTLPVCRSKISTLAFVATQNVPSFISSVARTKLVLKVAESLSSCRKEAVSPFAGLYRSALGWWPAKSFPCDPD